MNRLWLGPGPSACLPSKLNTPGHSLEENSTNHCTNLSEYHLCCSRSDDHESLRGQGTMLLCLLCSPFGRILSFNQHWFIPKPTQSMVLLLMSKSSIKEPLSLFLIVYCWYCPDMMQFRLSRSLLMAQLVLAYKLSASNFSSSPLVGLMASREYSCLPQYPFGVRPGCGRV